MIGSLDTFVREGWDGWFGERAPRHLAHALLAPGPWQGARAFVFMRAEGETAPRVFLKVAFDPGEGRHLLREFGALSRVRPSVDARLRQGIPEALDLWMNGSTTVMAQRVLTGRRLLVPHLLGRGSPAARRLVARYLRGVFSWSGELGRATTQGVELDGSALAETVELFLAATGGDGAAARLRSFGRALERSGLRWRPGWQHRDVSVGNVLVHRGRPRLLDWEHAGEDAEPWFDVAYAPGAMSILARHQAGGRESIQDAALRALGPRAWPGSLLRREMRRAWTHPLPLQWAVVVTMMKTALRRLDGGQEGSPPLADLAVALFADDELRRSLAWLAPEW